LTGYFTGNLRCMELHWEKLVTRKLNSNKRRQRNLRIQREDNEEAPKDC